MVNEDFWNQLPAQARELLEETMAEVTQWERDIAQKLNEEQLRELQERNQIKIYTLNNEERNIWQEDFALVYAKFAQK